MKGIKSVSAMSLIILFCLFTGCPITPTPTEIKNPLDSTPIEENSSLFVEEIDTEIISFYTNDTKYTGEYGYTLWTQDDPVQDPFSHMNVTLKKISGNDVAGYGVVFGSHEDTMLIVLIDTKKSFIIGELTGNLFTELQPWTNSLDLIPGYNQENNIDISYNSGTGDYSLSFNGQVPVPFRDDDAPFHTTGKDGYIVIISPLDNFPNIPVSVTFKKN